MLYMDLQGPFTASTAGYVYTLAVVDNHSHVGWKEYLKKKSDAPDLIMALITRLETQTRKKVKITRTNGGGEFVNDKLKEWYSEKGIVHQYTNAHTPEQNGVAEHFNQTTNEHAVCMLHNTGLYKSFWPEAHEYSSYIHDRSPTLVLGPITPHKVFTGCKPDLSTLCVFGSQCHVHIP